MLRDIGFCVSYADHKIRDNPQRKKKNIVQYLQKSINLLL